MFGFSFGEVVVLLLVGIVVLGPRQLPTMLRTLGRWVAKLQRMAFEMRAQSGIDDILRDEGLDRDLRQLRAILRRPNVLDALAIDVDAELAPGRPATPKRAEGTISAEDELVADDREYPIAGADAFGAVPEDLDPYGANADVAAESGRVHAPEVERAGGVEREQTAGRKSDEDQTQAKQQSAGRGGGGPPVSGTGTAR